MAQNNIAPVHPWERLPLSAPKILYLNPKVNLQHGRFITNEQFKLRVNAICFQIWKIQSFPKFACDNHHKIKERNLVYSDLHMLVEFLSMFFTKEFVDSKGMFRKVCRQHPFEFLIMFDLWRE